MTAALNTLAESSLAINDELTAFADEIVESPTGFYKLSGDVNINGVLYFNGEVKVDKRAGSEKYILGNDKIFAQTASGTYNINELKIPWEFIIQNERR